MYNPTEASWDNYDKRDSNLCHHQTGRSPPILNVTCGNGQIKGRFVKIIMKNYLCLCEVEIYGRRTFGKFNYHNYLLEKFPNL